jgi:lipopolysaccharide/colanic/teichoic acid biosynthesis glycosyltransferase
MQTLGPYYWSRRTGIRYNWRVRQHMAAAQLRMSGIGYRVSKRAVDISAALALFTLMAPAMIAIALAIKLTDRGPILFWQKRVGFRGRVFDFPKFRSMVPHADKMIHTLGAYNHHGSSITFKAKNDPRTTWIGRLIRRFSLDEIPQLWCVLRGDMSLVGPRPALPREVAQYRQIHRRRLDVTPGLTCTWQVSGRGDLPFQRQVELDIEYIEERNLQHDINLIFRTIPAVLTGRGAY